MRVGGIGVNTHYIPVHLHPYYQRRYGTTRGLCPADERAYGEFVSLPIIPGMRDDMVDSVIRAMKKVIHD
jgi:perosamine synthetase